MKQIIIEPGEIAKLQSAFNKLMALERAGVNNWEGYSYALNSYEEEFGEIEVSIEYIIEDCGFRTVDINIMEYCGNCHLREEDKKECLYCGRREDED